MVNPASTPPRAAERALAVSYAQPSRRAALDALLALDDVLGATVRSTREPLLGQIRLTWWHDALLALDTRPPPAEPVLTTLAERVLPRGVTGARLAALVDGWEALLTDPLDEAAMRRFACARGAGLFAAAAAVLGAGGDPVETAGEGWALADLAANLSDVATAERARAMARERLDAAFTRRWSRATRAIGAMALLARADLMGVPVGSPRRVGRLLRHRLTGG
jgi:phytoene synthase